MNLEDTQVLQEAPSQTQTLKPAPPRVRCIDCRWKKTCKKVKVNKFSRHLCPEYEPNLLRLSNIVSERVRLNKSLSLLGRKDEDDH